MPDILENLNLRFDHAILQQEVTADDIRQICREAREYGFFSVAVNPAWVSQALQELHNSPVKILSVSGFPLGAHRTDIKIAEAVKGVDDGAHEIDMVANIGWLVSGAFNRVEDEIATIRKAIPYNVVLKVIIEAGKLTTGQRADTVHAVINGGAQFVKTCTGFFGGATVEQVQDLFRAARGEIEVKASGGIRTLEQCRLLLEAGATRLGSSSSVAVMNELKNDRNE